jgi:hypothetical protein
MDLSHWDAVTFFNREQIACLLAGVDPNAGPYPPSVKGRVTLYRELVGEAIDNALRHAWEFVRGMREPPEVIAPDIFEYDAWENELPSFELRNSVADVMRDPVNVPILLASDDWYTEKFNRDDVHYWAMGRGLNKGYRFDGIANDRVPDIAHSSPIEQSAIGHQEQDALVQNAKAAANARHSRPGGSREKHQMIREIWRSGKYSSRDVCAEQECAALGMSFSSARKALRGTPEPT